MQVTNGYSKKNQLLLLCYVIDQYQTFQNSIYVYTKRSAEWNQVKHSNFCHPGGAQLKVLDDMLT